MSSVIDTTSNALKSQPAQSLPYWVPGFIRDMQLWTFLVLALILMFIWARRKDTLVVEHMSRAYDPYGTSLKYASELDHTGAGSTGELALSTQWYGSDALSGMLNYDGDVAEDDVAEGFSLMPDSVYWPAPAILAKYQEDAGNYRADVLGGSGGNKWLGADWLEQNLSSQTAAQKGAAALNVASEASRNVSNPAEKQALAVAAAAGAAATKAATADSPEVKQQAAQQAVQLAQQAAVVAASVPITSAQTNQAVNLAQQASGAAVAAASEAKSGATESFLFRKSQLDNMRTRARPHHRGVSKKKF